MTDVPQAKPDECDRETATINSNQNPEQQLAKVKRDLESMVIRYAKSESENLVNKAKSEELDKKLKRAIKDNESLANRIKILTNDKANITDQLNARVAQIAVLEQKNRVLSSMQTGKLDELEIENARLKETNDDLRKLIDTYKCKEAELLDFSERLSMKQVLLQTELDKAIEYPLEYRTQCEKLAKENEDMKIRIVSLTEMHRSSEETLARECEMNEKLRQEFNQLELKSKRSVEELENEMKVLRRKHLIATKELLKQLRCLQTSVDHVKPQNGNKVIN